MKRFRIQSRVFMFFATVIALGMLTGVAFAKSRAAKEGIKVREGRARSIIVTPDYDLRIDVWTDRASYYAGEDIRIFIYVNRDSYVYIFDTDTNGVTRQIFPNYYDTDNFLRSGYTYYIPDESYNLEITGPSGREYLRAIAISERYPFLREFERFDSSRPFPRLPGGVESFKHKLESKISRPQPPRITGQVEKMKQREGKLGVVPRPIRPVPRYRDYAESYTSFYVRTRWYSPRGDDIVQRFHYKHIRFESTPDDANLYIDGIYRGKTSEKVRLRYGPHQVRMRKRGYYDWVRSIYVNEDSPSRITAHLRRRSSRYWEPYRKEWDINFRDREYRGEKRSPRETKSPGFPALLKEKKLRKTKKLAPLPVPRDKE